MVREGDRVFEGLVGGRKIDLLELCAPWDSPLCQAVRDLGGTALALGRPHDSGRLPKGYCYSSCSKAQVLACVTTMFLVEFISDLYQTRRETKTEF